MKFDKSQVFDAKTIERSIYTKDSETFGIYVGFQEINGTIGPTKIGRTINVRALQRGRSQGGANWWFYAFWPLTNRQETYDVEKVIKKELSEFRFTGEQNQQELYDLSLSGATTLVSALIGADPILRSLLQSEYDTSATIRLQTEMAD